MAKKSVFKYIWIIAAVILSVLLMEMVSRAIIENNRDFYVNNLIRKYQARYPMITRKNLVSVHTTSSWWDTYIDLTFENATAEIDIRAQLYVLDIGESWILYEFK